MGNDTFDPSAFAFDSLNSLNPLNIDGFEDSPPFSDTLALEDVDPLFPMVTENWDQGTPPYDGNLYSTPLSWEAPEPKIEPLPLPLPLPLPSYTTMNVLTPAQQEKLANIAMPQHLQYRTQHSPNSNTSRSVSSPEGHDGAQDGNERSRKRKSSAEADDDDDEDSNPPVKKTAHNMIEKRYRTNLNDKIAALRDSVPSLRIMSKSQKGEDTADDREDLQGLTPAHKLNKATVLSKATEYINFLEKKNKKLDTENREQKARLSAFETLFRSGSMGFNPAPIPNYQFATPDYSTPGPSPGAEISGMIQVPEEMRRLHAQMGQQAAFAVPQEHYQPRQQQVQHAMWNQGNIYNKMMLGSLAGLMIMDLGFSQSEQETDSPSARGLFAVPMQFVRGVIQQLHSLANVNLFGYHLSGAQVFGYMRLFLVIGVLLMAIAPRLSFSKPKSKNEKQQSAALAAAPSLASPIQVRRQAWLTAIQTVWIPQHNFLVEASALLLKICKVVVRNVVGYQTYAYFTGVTQQQEAARVKAWEIALDAQLAGGDVEVSISRLLLTLLASYTLPTTPARLMLRALHYRVLFWELGNASWLGLGLAREFISNRARSNWASATVSYQFDIQLNGNQEQRLPSYLAALLAQDCDEVLNDVICQRAYNLAWNLPTTKSVVVPNSCMDGVVDDSAIRSPLDAVAAWYSSLVLQRTLFKSLEGAEDDKDSQKRIALDIALAIRTSPLGSKAQLRALVARAVLVKAKRGLSIAESIKALGLDKKGNADNKSTVPNLVNAATSVVTLPDLKMSLNYAIAIAHLERFSPPANPSTARQILATFPPVNLSLLGFTAAFKLMEKVNAHEPVATNCSSNLERFAGDLRIWIGSEASDRSGLKIEAKKVLVERCLVITKRMLGIEDAGYESMPDEDAGEGC